MPIETDIPLEIEGYQKKIVFGLTLRQLICLVLTLPLAVGLYFFCTLVLGLSSHNTGWLVMTAACPALAIGFVRPDGEPFERFLLRKLRHQLWTSRLCYAAEPEPGLIEAEPTKRKGGIPHGVHPTAGAAENTFRARPGQKGKRKQTARRIKAAQKEYRQASARAKQARRGAGRA